MRYIAPVDDRREHLARCFFWVLRGTVVEGDWSWDLLKQNDPDAAEFCFSAADIHLKTGLPAYKCIGRALTPGYL